VQRKNPARRGVASGVEVITRALNVQSQFALTMRCVSCRSKSEHIRCNIFFALISCESAGRRDVEQYASRPTWFDSRVGLRRPRHKEDLNRSDVPLVRGAKPRTEQESLQARARRRANADGFFIRRCFSRARLPWRALSSHLPSAATSLDRLRWWLGLLPLGNARLAAGSAALLISRSWYVPCPAQRPREKGNKPHYDSRRAAERKSPTVAAAQFSPRRVVAMIGSGRSRTTSTLAWPGSAHLRWGRAPSRQRQIRGSLPICFGPAVDKLCTAFAQEQTWGLALRGGSSGELTSAACGLIGNR
jgi:hypothetical protein